MKGRKRKKEQRMIREYVARKFSNQARLKGLKLENANHKTAAKKSLQVFLGLLWTVGMKKIYPTRKQKDPTE